MMSSCAWGSSSGKKEFSRSMSMSTSNPSPSQSPPSQSTLLIPSLSPPKLHALDLVEICELIALELSKQDLVNCICVCKAWSNKFLPCYWRTVSVPSYKTARYSSYSTLSKHGSLVRSLTTGIIGDVSIFNQPSLSHLRHLEVSTSGSKVSPDHGRGCLGEIVSRNKESLLDFHWRCYGGGTRPFQLWTGLFEGLTCLTTIRLSNWSMSKDDFMEMLRACPSLNHLTLEASEETKRFEADQINLVTTPNTGTLEGQEEGEEEGEEGEEEESENHSSVKPSKKLKSSTNKLPLPSPPEFTHPGLEHLHFIGNLIPSFLQYVPNIKSLKLTTILYGDFQDMEHQLQMMAQAKQMQSTETTETTETTQCLSHITHLYTLTKCQNPSQYMSLINAIPTPNHLVHFEGQVPARIARRFLEIMVEQQSESIERLIVIPGSNTEFQEQEYSPLGFEFNIWRILERCPQLTVLEIPYFLGYASIYITSRLKPVLHGDGSEAGVECVDIVRKIYEPIQEWVCKDLRRLYLRIKDMDRMNPMEQITFDLCVDRLVPPEERQEGDAHRKTLTTRSALEKMVLHKLSGLQKLEELNIGSGWYTLPAWTHPRHHHH